MALPKNWKLEEILLLTYFRGVNYRTLIDAVENFSSYDKLLSSALATKLSRIKNQGELFPDNSVDLTDAIKRQIDEAEKHKSRIVTFWDEEYPDLLKEITHPPIVIFVKGNLQTSDAFAISMVGTRRNTSYGTVCAENFAEFFANSGIVIVSGLAYGIDSISHDAAMNAGGVTYAVIASGIDQISPQISLKRAEKIVDSGGAIISEYKFGTKARPGYFPQRNRIISGISKAVLIVESAAKGGSLITGKFAIDQNRELFAIPGRINSEKSKGCNELIRKSTATPALDPQQVLDDLDFAMPKMNLNHKENQAEFTTEEDKIVYDIISDEPLHIDKIAENCQLDMPVILISLLNLEFAGLVRQLPGKNYIRSN